MLLSTPRLVIAGLAGDSGKTLVTLGVARALKRRGLKVAPFKKGPDYIDAAWLEVAARSPGRNLDTFIMAAQAIGASLSRARSADLALVEGNRGLFDGFDADGTHSTAELAKLIGAPVVLVIDVTKMTRTTAALVQGCAGFDPQLKLGGVLLNRLGTARQERVIRDAISRTAGPPVLGALPRLDGDPLPGRHLGLLTAVEHPRRQDAVERAAQAIETHVDLDALLDLARGAGPTELPDHTLEQAGSPCRIGVFRDRALSFYYPENLEALEQAGATLVNVSPLADRVLPELDALYFGGGFPEVHVDRLAHNLEMREEVRAACAAGMPVYAECGGLMYLSRELVVDGVSRPMAGALDLVVEQTDRPQGHGYVEATVDRPNPFFPTGTQLRGHEFHYSRVVSGGDAEGSTLSLMRGRGLGGRRDGVVKDRIWASYLHLHALGTPTWATAFASLARAYRSKRKAAEAAGSGNDQGDRPGSGTDSMGSSGSPGLDIEGRDGAQRGGQAVAAARG
jgi:cobyrinic acid a,c-diamide synthase